VRILVADDVPDAAEALSMLLQLDGHEVTVAIGGLQAIALADSVRPRVAVLDIGMPDVDGYEVARSVRRETWGQAVHLIALTGRDDGESRRLALAAGFQQYLVKPIDPSQFLQFISEIEICAS
jgi:DNA-binding response OmpR family regulator